MTEIKEQYLVDSNILVYAYDKSETKKHVIATETVKAAWNEQCGSLSMQNIAEFYSVVTRKIEKPLPIGKAKQIVLDLLDGFEIIKYDEKTIINAINYEENCQIPFWDALIAATMEENRIETIITENEKDFKKIGWIKTINPFK